MSDGYAPREGSLAHQVIELLRAGEVDHLDAAAIAVKFDCNKTSVATSLKPAVNAGVLQVEKVGQSFLWSLAGPPPPPMPTDGALQIANWNDGDVTVKGGQHNEDESVTYTRDQILQLLQHVTLPHIAAAQIAAPAVQG